VFEAAFVIQPPVVGSFAWAGENRSFAFRHEVPFDAATNYVVKILGTASDETGATLDGNFNRAREGSPTDDFVWTFRFPIANDDFASAQLLTGPIWIDPGEQSLCFHRSGRTVRPSVLAIGEFTAARFGISGRRLLMDGSPSI
jgi:hypothetical protein